MPPKPDPALLALCGLYRDSSGKEYLASLCPHRGLLLTRQQPGRLRESFAYDVVSFRQQLLWGTFKRVVQPTT